MKEVDDGESLDWVEEQLEAWLTKKEWGTADLVGLLEGYEIPFSTVNEEPYLAVLEALPEGGDRYSLEEELARRAAALLDKKPDEAPVGDPPERLLYNLLSLCSGLACPDQLADPLLAMWKRRSLKGEWQGTDLRYVLSVALASNQFDSRMAEEWWAMLEKHATKFLPGSEYDGFEAVLWMPESKSSRGTPFLNAIGRALSIMARSLEEDRNRRPEFRRLLRKVKETYPDRLTWDTDFIDLADRYNFPTWAIESLPTLFQVMSELSEGVRIVRLWYLLVNCMNDKQEWWGGRKALCQGRLVEIKISNALFPAVFDLIRRVEDRRNDFPLRSERALHGAVSDLLGSIEESAAPTSEVKKILNARQDFIKELRKVA